MKHIIFFISVLVVIIFSSKSFSQSEYAVPYLTFSVSPSSIGMGATGNSLPNDEPCGFLQNPAQLGFTSQKNNIAISFCPGTLKYTGFNDISISNLVLNAGYNFKDRFNVPLSIGFGISRTSYYSDDFFYTNDVYSAFSFGAGLDYGIQLNLGISVKNISSTLIDHPTSTASTEVEALATAFDFGLLINFPIIKTKNPDLKINLFDDNPMYPTLSVSLGYSQLNIGDEIYYVDPAQADPLPRLAKLGYGLAFGLDMDVNQSTIKAFVFDLTVDAQDILIDRKLSATPAGDTVLTNSGYQSFLGDIDIAKNIFMIEGTENAASKFGLGLEIFEMFSFRLGSINGYTYNDITTYGLELKSDGFLKLIASEDKPDLTYIADHFGLRFSYANYKAYSKIDLFGISLFIKNFNSIF